MAPSGLWAVFTLGGAAAQTFRNAMQRELIGALGAVGAAQVRFLFGLPFAVLFLVVVAAATGEPVPSPSAYGLAWAVIGAVAQIVATALMLAAMRERSFVVVVAATKTEAAQVAVFALVFLGERPTAILIGAIVLATLGVWLMTAPAAGAVKGSWRSIAMGLISASFFAIAAIGYRASIRTVPTDSFVMAATDVLVLGLAIQTALLFVYLAAVDRARVALILRAWRPSLVAGFMGALASQFWFIAFALSDVARVRTLALVEVLFAQAVSMRLFREMPTRREIAGMTLIVAAAVVLVSGIA